VMPTEWTLIAYVISKLAERKGSEIDINEIEKFVFDKLWVEYKLALCDSSAELRQMLEYLKKLQIIDIKDNKVVIKDRDRLKRIAICVEHAPIRSVSKLYEETISRIERAASTIT